MEPVASFTAGAFGLRESLIWPNGREPMCSRPFVLHRAENSTRGSASEPRPVTRRWRWWDARTTTLQTPPSSSYAGDGRAPAV